MGHTGTGPHGSSNDSELLNTYRWHETCAWCSEPTGRAGEDSIYIDDIGPWCEECYHKVRNAIDNTKTIELNNTITTLRKLCDESLEVIADIIDNWMPVTDKVKHLRQQLEELPHG